MKNPLPKLNLASPSGRILVLVFLICVSLLCLQCKVPKADELLTGTLATLLAALARKQR